ncbi:MAG: Type 1 glutamine amidotransferase-like domain-containing protein [Acidobacteriota bacterium]
MSRKLNLPRPPGRGWIVLIGGGEFSFGETAEIDRFLLERIPAQRKRLRFLPTASGSMDYPRHFGAYIQGLDPDVEFMSIPIYRTRDARREKNLALIRGSGIVYLGGGVSGTIAEVLRQPQVMDAFREVLLDGGIIAAIGGAAAALGAVIGDPAPDAAAPCGLDLIPGSAIVAPLDPADDHQLRALSSLPAVTVGIGIPARTAVAIGPEGASTILGEGSIAIVRKPPPEQ